MRWVRDPPCLVLQWVDSKVVSLLSNIERELMIMVLSTGKEMMMMCGP